MALFLDLLPETPPIIRHLEPNQVFVFGSNLSGIHGAGAALIARRFGAKIGVGVGHCGSTYAIPTKDSSFRTLPLSDIQPHIRAFSDFVLDRKDLHFLLTPIGCGLAGYTPEDIAPLFTPLITQLHSRSQSNLSLPCSFISVFTQA